MYLLCSYSWDCIANFHFILILLLLPPSIILTPPPPPHPQPRESFLMHTLAVWLDGWPAAQNRLYCTPARQSLGDGQNLGVEQHNGLITIMDGSSHPVQITLE